MGARGGTPPCLAAARSLWLGGVRRLRRIVIRSFSGGVMKGLWTKDTGVPERKLDVRRLHLSCDCNARWSKGSAEFAFIASPRPARAMDDAVARVMSTPGCLDQDL